MATASNSSSKQPSGGDSLSGLGFNQTGREETAREVLKPQRDPAAGKRTVAIIAVVVLCLVALGAMTLQRSVKPSEVFKNDDSHAQFAVPSHGE